MPEGHKAERRRQQKQNIKAGIGDENGKIVRVKPEAKMAVCVECKQELKITKSNTELKTHAANKHGKTIEECFPGAEAIAAEMIRIAAGGKKGGRDATKSDSKSKKKPSKADLDDIFSAGLSAGPGGKKKKGAKK
jgi:hypothetical protein